MLLIVFRKDRGSFNSSRASPSRSKRSLPTKLTHEPTYINTVDLIARAKYGGPQSFGRRLEHCGRVDPAEWREPCRTSLAFRSAALHEHCMSTA